MLIINSSANFVYYCMIGRSFREHCIGMLREKCAFLCSFLPKRTAAVVSSGHENPTAVTLTTSQRCNDIEMTQVEK